MVVPIFADETSETVRNYVGDGLRLVKKENRGSIQVIGNGCYVHISENSGSLKVLGDGCCVKVKRGKGSVQYVGDGGNIRTGSGVDENLVTYVGRGGVINEKSVEADKNGRRVKNKSVLDVFNKNAVHFGDLHLSEGIFSGVKVTIKTKKCTK